MTRKELDLIKVRDSNWTAEDIQRHQSSIAFMPVQDRRALLLHIAEQEAVIKDLYEQVSALESREVCTVAHDNVETCGYCQRDALQRYCDTVARQCNGELGCRGYLGYP
jgi:hypothetical protein